jgi:hypothetical protein
MGALVSASCFFISFVLTGAAIWAQTAAPQSPGSVTGHVYCADTNRPARLARVTIEPVEDLNPVIVDAKGNILRTSTPTATLTETGMDGGYSFENVAPGQYYVVAELPGYLSPVTEFTSEEFRLPTEKDERRFRETLQRVTVFSGQTARMDFRLERGGAIEGRVLYNDGSAVTGATILVLRKDETLGWTPVPDMALDRFQSAPTTDDRGRYRVAMLAPGDYVVAVVIQHVRMISGGAAFAAQTIPRDEPGGTRIYLGDATSRADAKPVTLHRAEEYSGADITVPTQKLHTVSGTVVATRDGHPIDSAHLSLVDAADGSFTKETWVSFGTGRFTMMFVPDGKYVLKVTNGADGVIESTPTEGAQFTNTHFVPHHVYADTELPLQVGGDVSGFTVKVPEPAGHRP